MNSIFIRDLKFNKHRISKYIVFFFFLLSRKDKKLIIIIIAFKKIHFIDNFKTKMFIKMNFIILKKIDILIFKFAA